MAALKFEVRKERRKSNICSKGAAYAWERASIPAGMPYQQRARKESPDDLDKGALTREEETSEEEEEPQGETRGSSHALPKKHTPPNRPVGSGINVGGSSGGSSGSKRPIFVISAIVE